MGVGVGERAETVVIFLTSRIPKSKLNVLAINLNIGNVVLKDGGNVDLRGLMLDQERITQVNSRIRWRTGDDGS
jgi:hypothetical protein